MIDSVASAPWLQKSHYIATTELHTLTNLEIYSKLKRRGGGHHQSYLEESDPFLGALPHHPHAVRLQRRRAGNAVGYRPRTHRPPHSKERARNQKPPGREGRGHGVPYLHEELDAVERRGDRLGDGPRGRPRREERDGVGHQRQHRQRVPHQHPRRRQLLLLPLPLPHPRGGRARGGRGEAAAWVGASMSRTPPHPLAGGSSSSVGRRWPDLLGRERRGEARRNGREN